MACIGYPPISSCLTAAAAVAVPRRSANYDPSSWDYSSLIHRRLGDGRSSTTYEKMERKARNLLLRKSAPPAQRLRLIDTLQRLGVAHRFQEDIDSILTSIISGVNFMSFENVDDLTSPTLLFRLLRQRGIHDVSPDDALASLKEGNGGGFKAELRRDVDGLLSLYEASYLAFDGEDVLDEARAFATRTLRDVLVTSSGSRVLQRKVSHALGLPLHWRAEQLEAASFIQQYSGDRLADPSLVQFARMEFNRVQSVYQDDLAAMATWWRETALTEQLSFARDRLMENFHCAACIVPQPELTKARQALTQLCCLVVLVDDVYDIYGTLDELVLFTDAVGRWSLEATKDLPEYMRAIYSAIFNTSNRIAMEANKEHGRDAVAAFKKTWHDICKAYLAEAKWHYNGVMPTSADYLENGWMTSTAPLLLTHAFPLLAGAGIPQQQQFAGGYARLVRAAAMIVRLCNDSATHSAELARGDAPSSIALHMRENKSNEEESRAAMSALTVETWKEINGEAFRRRAHLPAFIAACVNIARASHCIYQGGVDGLGSPDEEKKSLIKALYLHPMPLVETPRSGELLLPSC